MHFIFLTRCYRPTNIATIKKNIEDTFKGSEHSYLHVILVDLTHGENQETFTPFVDNNTLIGLVSSKAPNDTQMTIGMDDILNMINSNTSYVYILDDDNLLHKDFLSICEDCDDEDAVVFKIVGRPELGNPSIMNMHPVCHIDWANYITKLGTMKKLKIYHGGTSSLCEDGLFFLKLMQNKCKIKFVNKEIAFYNRLPKP